MGANVMEYTCAACNETFLKSWADEEALKEFKDHFGHAPAPDDPVVCDDCYRKIMRFNEGENWDADKSLAP